MLQHVLSYVIVALHETRTLSRETPIDELIRQSLPIDYIVVVNSFNCLEDVRHLLVLSQLGGTATLQVITVRLDIPQSFLKIFKSRPWVEFWCISPSPILSIFPLFD